MSLRVAVPVCIWTTITLYYVMLHDSVSLSHSLSLGHSLSVEAPLGFFGVLLLVQLVAAGGQPRLLGLTLPARRAVVAQVKIESKT